MGFVGVYRAIYDYEPRSEGELAIQDGDLLFILDKSDDDDWWRAKKKATDDQDEEPEGLIPNNYIDEAQPEAQAKTLYDYSRQTDEELSFPEDALLDVYDTSDPEWTLVALHGEYGFVPANYIELGAGPPSMPARPRAVPQSPAEPGPEPEPEYTSPQQQPNPTEALGRILQQRTGSTNVGNARSAPQQHTPEASDEDQSTPSLPQRPISTPMSPPPTQHSPRSPEPEASAPGIMASPNSTQIAASGSFEPTSPGGYHLYNIHEMISHMGKNKKMPTTLGINTYKGLIMIAPEKSRDGPQKEWTADKLTHYSIEGKHVFMELVRPSKSIDFHAGAKDTAQEITSALGELAGAARAPGLSEVIAASRGSGQKRGRMRFAFTAQSEDEVTVDEQDEVIVLDDMKSDEWWQVRRIKDSTMGVVPSSYVEVTGVIEPPRSSSALNTGQSFVEQNRREEERQVKEAIKRSKTDARRDRDASSRSSKPNPDRVRVWTDRSGSFKVEAEFLGLKDGKIHLHKTNAVKIAVAVSKMSIEDIEYVERATGESLDEEKPLSDIKRRSTQKNKSRSSAGASVEHPKPKYDWFDFFLQCGVNPQICERYAMTFDRDQMGEENMQDIEPTLLRTLGIKEGDILRIMKHLDEKYGRSREQRQQSATQSDGLFSGPGGTLRNNTRKGRPAPAVESTDTVDPRAFEQDSLRTEKPNGVSEERESKHAPRRTASGFDDDAWNVKPSNKDTSARVSSPPSAAPQRPVPTGAISDLSILDQPLQPSPAVPPAPRQEPQQQQQPPPQLSASAQQPQPTGANRALFDQLAQQQPAPSNQISNQPQPLALPRPRPQAPLQTGTSSFLPPPPGRPSSAPQNQQPSAFAPPPMQPQLTGYQPQIAPPGQSLQELSQQKFQAQQFGQQPMQPQQTGYNYGQQPNGFAPNQLGQQMQPQPTGYSQPQPQQLQPTGFPQTNGFFPQQQQQQQPQQTGFQPQFQSQFLAGQQSHASPFADPPRQPYQPLPPQQTGYQQSTYTPGPMQPQQTGVNSILPPALQPQPTGNIMNGFGGSGPQPPGFAQRFEPPPPPPPPQPLQQQKTGPAPNVKFGVGGKLAPQPTGRANLANATPANPFGF